AERANQPKHDRKGNKVLTYILVAATILVLAGITIYASWCAISMLREIDRASLALTLKSAIATFFRVNVALLVASAWTIPAGVAIGFHPRLARIAQPLAQIAASVPATALFPVLLLALV